MKWLQAFDIDAAQERESETLLRVREAARDLNLPNMHMDANEGRFLSLLVRLLRPKLGIEFGTFLGYSAICIGSALGDGGELISFERDPLHAKTARRLIGDAGLAYCVRVIEEEAPHGPSLRSVPNCDLCLIDAAWGDYPGLAGWALDNVRIGGLIILHNVQLAFASAGGWSDVEQAAFNEWLKRETLSSGDTIEYEAESVLGAVRMLLSSKRTECMLFPSSEGILVATIK